MNPRAAGFLTLPVLLLLLVAQSALAGPTASIQFRSLGSHTLEFSVVPADNQTVSEVEWDFGDGKNGTGSPVTHTYPSSGSYIVRAAIAYRSGVNETAESAVHIGTDPNLFEYFLGVLLVPSFVGAVFTDKQRRKMLLASVGLASGAYMLFLFDPTAFPVFMPRFLVQLVVLIAGLAALVYAFLPSDGSKPRGFWIVLGAISIVIYLVTAL